MVTRPQVLLSQDLVAWAVDASGVPVSATPNVVSATANVKDAPVLHEAGSELWLTWRETPGLGQPGSSLRAARLGAGAVLLDGTPAAPGRVLLDGSDARAASASVWIGQAQSLIGWTEGWNTLRGARFDTALLAAGGTLPTEGGLLAVEEGSGAGFGPSRSLVAAGDFGGSTLALWLDNMQFPGTASDRVQAVRWLPRLAR